MTKSEWALQSSPQNLEIHRKSNPQFYHLYQQSVLLALHSEGLLDDSQLQLCLDALESSTT